MTEWLHFHFSLSRIGEGNGNPLQCSCLENPRDGRAWWAAVYGVAQSRTWLKWLSSSSGATLQIRVNSSWLCVEMGSQPPRHLRRAFGWSRGSVWRGAQQAIVFLWLLNYLFYDSTPERLGRPWMNENVDWGRVDASASLRRLSPNVWVQAGGSWETAQLVLTCPQIRTQSSPSLWTSGVGNVRQGWCQGEKGDTRKIFKNWSIIDVALCKFKMCRVLIWYTYILQHYHLSVS